MTPDNKPPSYTTTVTCMSVHPNGSSPIFGERLARVSLDDEGAGVFITLTQDDAAIRLDPEELPLIFDTARRMLSGANIGSRTNYAD